MKNKTANSVFVFILMVLLGFLPATCKSSSEDMANPASIHCEEQGGTLDIRTAADGSQVGYCVFDDGSECEEWSFLRGECVPGEFEPSMDMANPASVHCEEQGGTLDIRTAADGGQVGYCVFDDGSECEEWSFFRGECEPGE